MRGAFEDILAYVLFAVGSALVFYVAFARRLHIHRPQHWAGGGEVTRTGEWAFALFFFGMGVAALSATQEWMPPGLGALGLLLVPSSWVVGFLSSRNSRRRYLAECTARRNRNAALHPGIFDRPAPTDLAATPSETLDLYDLETCTYLGTIARRDMLFLLDRFEFLVENGNDLFLIFETIELLPQDAISPESRRLLESALEREGELTLRWTPPATSVADGQG